MISAVVLITGDSPSHHDLAALTDGAGHYRFSGLRPGRYTLLVNAPGFSSQKGSIDVHARKEAFLNFELD